MKKNIILLIISIIIMFTVNCVGKLDKDKVSKIMKDYTEEIKTGKIKTGQDQQKIFEKLCDKHGVTIDAWNEYLSNNPNVQKEVAEVMQKALTGGFKTHSTLHTDKKLKSQPEQVKDSTLKQIQPIQPQIHSNLPAGEMDMSKFTQELQATIMKMPQDKQMKFFNKMSEISQKAMKDPQNSITIYKELLNEMKKVEIDVSKLENMISKTKVSAVPPKMPVGKMDMSKFTQELQATIMKMPQDKQMQFVTKMSEISQKAMKDPQNSITIYKELLDEMKKVGIDVSKLENMISKTKSTK